MEIPVPNGFKTMEQLAVGDTVYDEHGQPTEVLYATEIIHGRTCYEVVFDDGTKVMVDAEHEWLTWDKAARKSAGRRVKDTDSRLRRAWPAPRALPSVVTTAQIKNTLTVGRGERNHSIPVCGPVAYPEQALPIAPYTLGAWLGDGDSAGAAFTGVDPEILDRIKADGYRVTANKSGGAPRYSLGAKPPKRNARTGRMEPNGSLRSALKALGVAMNKHIPAAYLTASVGQRTDLLMGLMDTDGSITAGGNCEFTTVRRTLADEVLQLTRSLGIKAALIEDRARVGGKDCGPRFRVTFTPNTAVFHLPRKLARQRKLGLQSNRTTHRYIVDVRPIISVPVRCIKVSSPSSLFLCSRSFIATHNTRTGAEFVRAEIEAERAGRVALVAPTAADARDVMVEGESGLLAIAPSWNRPNYEPSKRRVTWPNGAMATVYSADEPERLRGPQHDLAWGDELAAWRYPEAWDMLMFGLRLGARPRAVVTTTPKPTRLIRELLSSPTTVITRGSTYDNRANLPPAFLDQIVRKYEGTRLGRQELHAEVLDDIPGALWTRAMLESAQHREPLPDMRRAVVAIDPAVTSGEGADETGIIVAGVGIDDLVYVLADRTCRMSPDGWATRAVVALDEFSADRIVAEVNNGGDLVEATIRTVRRSVPYRKVHATRGKRVRAEPIAALYEQGRVRHVPGLTALEDQMVTFLPEGSDGSPDRVDALVWALTELNPSPRPKRAPASSYSTQSFA